MSPRTVQQRPRTSVDITDRLFSEFSTRNDETIMSVVSQQNNCDKSRINSKLLTDLLEESVSYDINRQSLTTEQIQNQRQSILLQQQQQSRQARTKLIEQSPSTLDISSYTSDSLYNSNFVLTPLISNGGLELASNFGCLNSPSHFGFKQALEHARQSQQANLAANTSLPMPSPSTSANTLPSPPTFLNQHRQISSPTATYTSTSPLPPPPPPTSSSTSTSNIPPPPPYPTFSQGGSNWPAMPIPHATNTNVAAAAATSTLSSQPNAQNQEQSQNENNVSCNKSGLKKVKAPAKNSMIQVLAEKLALGGGGGAAVHPSGQGPRATTEEPAKITGVNNYGKSVFEI